MFLLRNKKNNLWIILTTPSYLDLCPVCLILHAHQVIFKERERERQRERKPLFLWSTIFLSYINLILMEQDRILSFSITSNFLKLKKIHVSPWVPRVSGHLGPVVQNQRRR